MRFLSADIVFPITRKPILNGILAVSANGTVADLLLPDDENTPDPSRIERFKGALCPGFVNAHCHLELSHMKGLIPMGTGLPRFLTDVVSKRSSSDELKQEAMVRADTEMWANGIQVVGDISNTADSIAVKTESRITYHTFVEVFSLDPGKSRDAFDNGFNVLEKFIERNLPATMAPHAPYSVSSELFRLVAQETSAFNGPTTIHNQETESENDMFLHGNGKLMDVFRSFGVNLNAFKPSGTSSIRYSVPLLDDKRNSILVHNTFTDTVDQIWAQSTHQELYWCTCPNANEYIEGRIPNLADWKTNGADICVGTDSLASNQQLSILEELRTIQRQFPAIHIGELLKWGTCAGARALGLDAKTGSFEKGKLPGVLLLKEIDLESERLTDRTCVQRII
jgi:cytosine/adenosine deaminase-related metal-dependent hydrolase